MFNYNNGAPSGNYNYFASPTSNAVDYGKNQFLGKFKHLNKSDMSNSFSYLR